MCVWGDGHSIVCFPFTRSFIVDMSLSVKGNSSLVYSFSFMHFVIVEFSGI